MFNNQLKLNLCTPLILKHIICELICHFFHGKLELFPKWLHFNYMYVYNLTSLFSCRQWEEVRKKQQATALFFPVSQSKIHSLPVF